MLGLLHKVILQTQPDASVESRHERFLKCTDVQCGWGACSSKLCAARLVDTDTARTPASAGQRHPGCTAGPWLPDPPIFSLE